MRPLNRITPNHPVGVYKTFQISAPPDTWVKAACEQVNCAQWRAGWESVIDESTELGRRQAAYIRHRSGRTFREVRRGDGLTVFRFSSGQRCFANHRTRRELYLVRDGDWRGNPTGRRHEHTSAADWVEDFGEHQARLAEDQQRG